jgi:tol-pal system protein YbgF
MPKVSRSIWIGVVVMMTTAPVVVAAQEYLPPVIDRSAGAVQQPATQSGRPAPQAQQAPQSVEARLTRIEHILDNKALVDMLMRLDSLQTEVQTLRGDLETLTHEMEGTKQRQRDLYLDVDRRLRQVEVAASQSHAPAAPAAPATPASAPAVGGQPPAASLSTPVTPAMVAGAAAAAAPATVDPAAERAAYEKAFNSLKEGQYDQAISEFQGFLSNYPKGDYTDNAQYWLGEANYVTRRFKQAEQEFLKVINQFPDSSKVSDASLKLGYTYYELGDWAAARKTLENVVSHYPNTTVARLADNRLQKMRLEGR